ncbi:MAG: UvrD-helicase domain-containing protein, partial [Lachnospiraceae bacterium]
MEERKLSREQAEAVAHCDGPKMVIAGPGSGKTFVITRRLEHMIRVHGVRPEEILVITFTKAAATEMQT